MKDFALILTVIFGMEVIDHVFGKSVGMAVSITALVAIIVFLWRAGKNAQAIEAPSGGETHASHCTVANCFLCEREAGASTEGESAVAASDAPKGDLA